VLLIIQHVRDYYVRFFASVFALLLPLLLRFCALWRFALCESLEEDLHISTMDPTPSTFDRRHSDYPVRCAKGTSVLT
jgi:hypothetical protein